jgi:acylphosphatase
MTKHLKIKIHGWVQGVGFRWSSYEQFVDLGLTGKAENGRDGTVEIDVTGEEAALEQFVNWARQGPQGAKVSEVEIEDVIDKNDKIDGNDKNNQDN